MASKKHRKKIKEKHLKIQAIELYNTCLAHFNIPKELVEKVIGVSPIFVVMKIIEKEGRIS